MNWFVERAYANRDAARAVRQYAKQRPESADWLEQDARKLFRSAYLWIQCARHSMGMDAQNRDTNF